MIVADHLFDGWWKDAAIALGVVLGFLLPLLLPAVSRRPQPSVKPTLPFMRQIVPIATEPVSRR